MNSITQNATGQTERNYGIDLLRILAMFLIVVLHILGQGGVLENANDAGYHIARLMEILAYCAVDCYAIISGFVWYSDREKSHPFASFPSFWLKVFTYSFLITVTFYFVRPGFVTFGKLLHAAFPVASVQYWYVSAYAGVFFIRSLLNRLVRYGTERDSTKTVCILVGVFSLYTTFAFYFSDPFSLGGGYSFVWLAVLYVVGAWMKRCRIPERTRLPYVLLAAAGCVLFEWAWETFAATPNLFRAYISFPYVVIAFTLVVVFARLRVVGFFQKTVSFFAPAAFGVYLIHVHPILYDSYFRNAFRWIASSPAWLIPLEVLGCAFGILVVCLLIEKLRLLLFRALKIDALTNRFSAWLGRTVPKLPVIRKLYKTKTE